MSLPDLAAWQLESLRLTIFSSGVLAATGQAWWQKCTGLSPESSGSRLQQGEYFEVGSYFGGTLEMKVAFNRMDWMLTPPPAVGSYPSLGNNVQERVDQFVTEVSSWVSSLNFPLVRVAFGLVALHRVEARAQANRTIKDLVRSLNVDEERVRDLALQLSYPMKSEVLPDLEITCLSKWMSIQAQLFTMQAGAMRMPVMDTQLFARSEFDVFSAADNTTEISREKAEALEVELTRIAVDQLKNGLPQ